MSGEVKAEASEDKCSGKADVLTGQQCPMCHSKTLTLTEAERDIPYFGRVYLFSMSCSSCNYHKSDVECVEEHAPSRYEIDVSGEEDMKIRVVRSSQATVKIPRVVTIEPAIASNGYITNVEGIIERVKQQIGSSIEDEDDETKKKQARKLLKKINRAVWGQDELKIIIEDPSGNSSIVSEKAVMTKLKGSK
ncbi:hypothetical protein AUJ69_02740 [Candidatus Woesearchaeota archaeon CG1_02_47_18]|nr:MAG: hypothetical protein AUJ69_02740 [Candidatus Woesearchaeota archaeon CG1_02_47_18]